MNNRNKIIILGVSVGAVLLIVLGITYAAYDYAKTGDMSSSLVAGDIYMHYKETSNVISIENAIPTKTYDPNEYFEFTIDGKNTYNEDIWYEIVLNYGEQPVGRTTRLRADLLRFTLTETISNVTKTVVDGATYEDFSEGVKIWVNTIPANTNDEIEITYKLYVWITEETYIGDEGTEGIDYSIDDWNNNIYASIRVDVNGDFEEKSADNILKKGPVIDVIKSTLENENGKGIIAVTKNNEKIDKQETLETELSNDNVREYRYSGPDVDNYIYFNCENETTEETASSNCEVWRVIGIFKDEINNEEYVKIVDNDLVDYNWFPATFSENNTEYNIQCTSSNCQNYSSAYWNYIKSSNADKNDWSTAGLQYWLNAGLKKQTKTPADGYLSYLSSEAKSMIRETKYYLGNVDQYDTPILSYTHERSVSKICSSECVGGDVWQGNAAFWEGIVAMMYPSDYGFSVNDSYWNTSMRSFGENDKVIANSSWMYVSMVDASSKSSWFLSPSKEYSKKYEVIYFNSWGNTVEATSGRDTTGNIPKAVRVVLNLEPQLQITSGDGSELSPWFVQATE